METTKYIAVQKPLRLDAGNFGHWKARMRHVIQGIDEDAWTAVEEGWTAPVVATVDDNGITKKYPKPKNTWTDVEKNASKFNSKAINAICEAVELDEFSLIQGCASAKEAWDILVNHFGGNTSVKRSRLDHLASQFENLRMEKDESITSFTTKISTLANEAFVLGKKYKDKKLVKKLLRCLPPKYAAQKTVVKYSMDSDDMKFDTLVGVLKAEELEATADEKAKQKDLTFAATTENDRVSQVEEQLSLLAKNFNKMLKRVEKGQNKSSRFQKTDSDRGNSRNFRSDGDRTGRKKDLQCHECEGYEHFRNECPLTKRKELKCTECRGFGHMQSECPNGSKSKEKSLMALGESESESEEEEDDKSQMLNFVAFVATGETNDKEETQQVMDSESEDEDVEFDAKVEYRKLYDNCVQLSKDNLQLVKDKAMMKAQINILEMEKDPVEDVLEKLENIKDEKLNLDVLKAEKIKNQELEIKLENLRKVCRLEKDKSINLQSQLTENHKKIRILNTGAENLDEILSMGLPPKKNWGLGYEGAVGGSGSSYGNMSNFVHGGTSRSELTQVEPEHPAEGFVQVKENHPRANHTQKSHQGTNANQTPEKRAKRAKPCCFFCKKPGHKKFRCYKFRNKVKKVWIRHLCYLEPKQWGKMWIAKRDLYDAPIVENACVELVCNLARIQFEETKHIANVAYTSSEGHVGDAWYFDSGCSRHMTGNCDLFDTISIVKAGNVTFGDGGQGKIQGVGNLERDDQPQLLNVFYVRGLKANLISVSQLCDEGLKVIFTRMDCKAVDENGNIVLLGIRSGNNCYMWSQSDQCLSARESHLELWHKRLGHMNTHGLSRLVKAEAIRGIPELDAPRDSVCEVCSRGKQIKVPHKAVSEIRSKKVLELIHMDLMGPVQTESIGGRRYIFVLVDDFSRFTWVRFLSEKSEATNSFKILALQLKTEKGNIVQIRNDHGGEFQNELFEQFCNSQGIRHQYSAPRTP
ncbi:uncharacterized protein LOC112085161 [Eutrema salsugineum]|uniref:uncharacterized protein LOC112085161 n=1 Tax=Eutrema salsugineum TaxID=72664 RepID=UPI000CED31C2|nr:uncharacterized protein LOC112085161 [Eutrema salsugineum]